MNKVCQYCKKEFNTNLERVKFCSKKCYWDSLKGTERINRIKRITKKCEICNKDFTVRICHKQVRTCSVKCGGIIRQGLKGEIVPRIIKKCIGCKKIMKLLPCKSKTLFCSHKCYLTLKSKNVKYPDKQRFQGSRWCKIRKQIIERDKVCIWCGSLGKEVHHIIPYSITGNDSLENLVLLCKSCHLKEHQRLWKNEKH